LPSRAVKEGITDVDSDGTPPKNRTKRMRSRDTNAGKLAAETDSDDTDAAVGRALLAKKLKRHVPSGTPSRQRTKINRVDTARSVKVDRDGGYLSPSLSTKGVLLLTQTHATSVAARKAATNPPAMTSDPTTSLIEMSDGSRRTIISLRDQVEDCDRDHVGKTDQVPRLPYASVVERLNAILKKYQNKPAELPSSIMRFRDEAKRVIDRKARSTTGPALEDED